MQSKQLGKRRWVLVLDRGEELVETLTDFLEEHEVTGGYLVGIGALKNITLGYFDLEKGEYLKRTFEEVMEMGNLTATIGTHEGRPVLHAHATLSGPELIAFTGHLFKGEVAVTAEIMLTDLQADLPREPDEETGLNLFAIDLRARPASKEESEA